MEIVDWPALGIGGIVFAYWARVLRLVFKTKRLTGRAANFLPPETLGRVLRIIWYPNVAAWIILPLISSFQPLYPRLPLAKFPWFTPWLALAAAAIVFGLTLICWKKMGRDWRMGIDPKEKNTLIISGPYALVRHPIYALQCLLALASVAAVPHLWMAIVAVVQIVLLQWEARREERHMVSVHGDVYGDYMRQVGRFIPRGRYRGGDIDRDISGTSDR